jgi:hypothetical protein
MGALPSFRAAPSALPSPNYGLWSSSYFIELFAEFTYTGDTYVRFPDPTGHRICAPNFGMKGSRRR